MAEPTLAERRAAGPQPEFDKQSVRRGTRRFSLAESLDLARKGSSALLDQALFSGGNFTISVLLARWLSATEYGAYSLAFAVFLLFASLHSALLLEPMMVFGSGKYQQRFRHYLRAVLCGHLGVMIPVSLALVGVAVALGRFYSTDARRAFLGLGFGATAILLYWLVRRTSYILMQPGRAVAGSALYACVLVGSGLVLRILGRLSGESAFLAMAFAGLLASALVLARLTRSWTGEPGGINFKDVVADHWHYGRWAISTAAIGWFPGQVYYTLLPAWLGLAGAASLRALMNFVMPAALAASALSLMLIPTLVQERVTGGMNRTTWLYLRLFLLGGGLYALLLLLAGGRLFALCYSGKYSRYSGTPMLLVASLPIGTCGSTVLGSALRALERPDLVFWSHVGSAVSALAVGIPLAASRGVPGALAGLLCSSVVTNAMLGFFCIQRGRLK